MERRIAYNDVNLGWLSRSTSGPTDRDLIGCGFVTYAMSTRRISQPIDSPPKIGISCRIYERLSPGKG